MSRRIVGPFNRVEGDLEVQLELADGRVSDAWVVSPMYRGFEQILQGKDPRDALIYAPRICGICSISQSVAAAQALASVAQSHMPPNGQLAINLIHAAENLADHFTHFYLFFMPDFAREVYRDRPWFDQVAARFKAVQGSATRDAVPARAQFMHLMGLLAGKWPHTLGIQPGGSSRPVEAQERVRLLAIIGEFRRYLERILFGDSLEAMLSIESRKQLERWRDAEGPSDFRLFLRIAEDLELKQLGCSVYRFMSYGVYPFEGNRLFRSGLWLDGEREEFDSTLIREDISHSWMSGQKRPAHPYQGVTLPDADSEEGYSWCKAPRLDGEPVEVGALARQLVDGNPLIRDLVQESGSNVRNRIIARILEIPRVLLSMERWCHKLQPGQPFYEPLNLPRSGQGFGLTEAARGSLGHWLRIRNGRILNYQIIAPTTWNFSPRDSEGIPGPLEQALVGAPVRPGEKTPVSVQHIVRSFDPCMVCTVH